MLSEPWTNRFRDQVAAIAHRIQSSSVVRWAEPILDDYEAGGGLLASGLAFNSLFAIMPCILLLISVLGVYLGDSTRLNAMLTSLSASFPPLAGLLEPALESFAHGAVTFSIIGLVALVWGASRFYQEPGTGNNPAQGRDTQEPR